MTTNESEHQNATAKCAASVVQNMACAVLLHLLCDGMANLISVAGPCSVLFCVEKKPQLRFGTQANLDQFAGEGTLQ